MIRIFISYRRAGDIGFVARLDDWLSNRYGAENVFRDIGKLKTGEDFDKRILTEINAADVVIAAIGNAWTGERWMRKPRIAQEEDWIRKELEHALECRIPVVPILVADAEVPKATDLPPSLLGVLDVNIGRIRDSNWKADFDDIADAIDRVTAPTESGADDPAVWHAIEIPPPSNAWKGYAALAALAVVVSGLLLWRYFAPSPHGVDLDNPATWTVPAVAEDARNEVAVSALRLALSDLHDSISEVEDTNAGFNVEKYTRRFGLTGVPWSAAFTTWSYHAALQRITNSPEPDLPFKDSPVTAVVANSLRDKGWLAEPVALKGLRPGDILFFDRGGRISHSELVYATDETRVCAIGGNVRNRVSARCYRLPNPRIVAASAIPPDAFQ